MFNFGVRSQFLDVIYSVRPPNGSPVEGSQVIIFKGDFLSLKIVFVLRNSVDPDEMLHNAAFHLGFHCLQKYTFRSHQYTKS